MSVVVVGSANLDTVYRLGAIPAPGETVLALESDAVPGGKGNNQAVAAARAGASVSFVVALGSDAAGDALAAAAEDARIDLHARRVAEPTGTAVIMVDRRGENAIVVDSGANRTLTTLNPEEARLVAGADVLLLQLETPMAGVECAAAAASAATTVILNAAPAGAPTPALLDRVDVLIVNEHEAALIAADLAADQNAAVAGGDAAGEASYRGLAAGLATRGFAVIVTLGSQGALVAVAGEEPVHVPGIPVTAIDTTGAGDTFCGALAAALDAGPSGAPGASEDAAERAGARGLAELVRAAEFATAAAALSVQRAGAVPSIPTLKEIDDFRAAH